MYLYYRFEINIQTSKMMKKSTRNKIKAISPLIATLILIAITIVGGIVVYRLFLSSGGAISQNLHATIGDVSLTESTLVVSVKNDGTFTWKPTKITISGGGITPEVFALSTPPTVGPGKSYGESFAVSSTLTAGTSYTISVEVTDATVGSTATFVTSASVYAVAG